MASFLWFANICGLISFSISGFITGRNRQNEFNSVISAVLTTFAGGAVLRDMFLLGIVPAALVDRTELYICIGIAVILQLKALANPSEYIAITKSPIFHACMLVADALGCGSYLTAGINKGIMYGLPRCLCISAGIFPAIGGGVIALIWIGVPFRKALTKNLWYKMMVVILSVCYYQLITCGEDSANSQVVIIIATIILCIMRELTEFFIHNADKLLKRFAYLQDNPLLYLPANLEVRYDFAYRGIDVPHMRFPNWNRAFRIRHHMLLH